MGKGGFGIVYLARDVKLHRLVAIKVPHAHLVAQSDQAEAYLIEARTVANLDHPNIVPVFDVGGTDQFPCFVVSKYIDGIDLATKLRMSRPSIHETAELLATIAEALHYAHKQGLVHRDIKPENILLDKQGCTFVADFGLALREQDIGKGPRYVGTPAYMSPEQARGEGHRVDGRCDIFSLGIVLYQMLTGRRPFKADTQQELLELISRMEVRPPRQIDDRIPKELERICLKAMAKRASERHTTAQDFAEDLRCYLARFPSTVKLTELDRQLSSEAALATPTNMRLETPATESKPIKIIPKGLRSFDAHDADFFLELLPGARDRDGLPDSIRFWKNAIEATDSDVTFSVGLIYGPSGCGKSSLVKAGLLTHLSDGVIPVYVEATAAETETRLLNGLRKRCSTLPNNLGLIDTLAMLRRGQGVSSGRKVVIILDQFEQWLHANKEEQNTELVQSLRHCDGSRVQCIVMVRDDFWMAATRFMRELEVRLLEGQNSTAADLFDVEHAKKVLSAFGRAFGRLPERTSDISKDQAKFLNQSVAGLAQEGKIISVRLALFAEMMKGKPWTSATLTQVGGTDGVGVAFLEDTFSTANATPEHRYHQNSARAVLKALLPDSGTDIKGHMRSYIELLDVSGYSQRPDDFDDLIRILDSEVRLITPTDPEGIDDRSKQLDGQNQPSNTSVRYYQLTHDYLVPSLREWLTRKQRETRRGRAELLLMDQTENWNARPMNRQLPTLWQWMNIRWWTSKSKWTISQQKMMDKASTFYAVRAMVVVSVFSILGWMYYEVTGINQAHALRDRLLDANTTEVPKIVEDMTSYRRWLDAPLRAAAVEAEKIDDSRKQLHIRLALLQTDKGQVDELYRQLLFANPHELLVIRDSLDPYKDSLIERLWEVARSIEIGRGSPRLRAVAALAKYDPNSQQWKEVRSETANEFVKVPTVYLAPWLEALRPARNEMIVPLSQIFRDTSRRETERSLATDILADYASDNLEILAGLLLDADEKQFAVIFAKYAKVADKDVLLLGEIDKKLPLDASNDAKENLAKRQANAAVALIRTGKAEKIWSLLKHSPDPRIRSYLIHRLGPLGTDPNTIVDQFKKETDVAIRRALLLSLGEFEDAALNVAIKAGLQLSLREIYCSDSDPGLHSSVEWLLRQWDDADWIKEINEQWKKDAQQREERLASINEALQLDNEKIPANWYVNGQGQTMVVIPGPVEFMMGSALTEFNREANETPHKKRIGRSFAIANKSVTVEQYLRFEKDYSLPSIYTRTEELPIAATTWYQAAAYCNWLSEQEGLPEDQWCYKIDNGNTILIENYLSLEGYRLPTESEMEYATRAGATTSHFYGETDELLVQYAWYQKNAQERTWPVGRLKPNDLGLFDTLGNVFAWCQESYREYPVNTVEKATLDEADSLVVDSEQRRIVRGGGYYSPSSLLRSANRNDNVPTYRQFNIGFRPARTLRSRP